MRIAVAGDWHSEVHEEVVAEAFEKLGHEVFRFPWHHYLKPGADVPFPRLRALSGKVQNRLMAGPSIARINKDFVQFMLSCSPEIVFVYRGTHIARESLLAVKAASPRTVLVGYNNDNPFAEGHPRLLWRRFVSAIPAYDLVLAYRYGNIADFRRAGARRIELLRSWFVPERNRPIELTPAEKEHFGCDVVFVGHYEPDGRVEALEEVARQGFDLKLYGPGYDWDPVIRKSRLLKHLAPVRLVWGDSYSKALSGAKVALCFLSRLNRDTYTRRCFEIPATGTLLMSEFTDDLAGLFEEDREAVFFRSPRELIEKLNLYVRNERLRCDVARRGYERVRRDGHDVVSRMGAVLDWIAEGAGTGAATI